jgi:hypothetical protein
MALDTASTTEPWHRFSALLRFTIGPMSATTHTFGPPSSCAIMSVA